MLNITYVFNVSLSLPLPVCHFLPGLCVDTFQQCNYMKNWGCHGLCHSCLSSSIPLLRNTFIWAPAHRNTPSTLVTYRNNNTSSVPPSSLHFCTSLSSALLRKTSHNWANNMFSCFPITYVYYNKMHWRRRCLNAYLAYIVYFKAEFNCPYSTVISGKQSVAALPVCSIVLPSCSQSVHQIRCM